MNSVNLIGIIIKAPILRKSEKGKYIVTFIVAIRDEILGKVCYVKCVAENDLALTIYKYCTKGTLVAVSGPIDSRKQNLAIVNFVYVVEFQKLTPREVEGKISLDEFIEIYSTDEMLNKLANKNKASKTNE